MRQNAIKALSNPTNVKFRDLCSICDKHFGQPKQRGDHRMYKTRFAAQGIINIQPDKKSSKMAKPYQVRQVKMALTCMLETEDKEDEQS